MSDSVSVFTRRLYGEWLPAFCHAPNRNKSTEGFVDKSISKLNAFDTRWFLCAVDSGLVAENDGFFAAPQSQANEQIFSSGSKEANPQPLYLWLEPIIAIGAVARLNQEFGWPIAKLALQEAANKLQSLIHRFTLIPGHLGSPQMLKCVNSCLRNNL